MSPVPVLVFRALLELASPSAPSPQAAILVSAVCILLGRSPHRPHVSSQQILALGAWRDFNTNLKETLTGQLLPSGCNAWREEDAFI